MKFFLLLFIASAVLPLHGKYLWKGTTFSSYAPQFFASKWIWNSSAPVTKNSFSLARFTFDLPENVKTAFIRVRFDDHGDLYVNGAKTPLKHGFSRIGKMLKKGRNVLAFSNHNELSVGGMIFYGEITLGSGKKVYLHSGSDVKAVPGPRKDNWFAADYDDSSWKKAKVFGDVLLLPWGKNPQNNKFYMTPAEQKFYDSLLAARKEKTFVPVEITETAQGVKVKEAPYYLEERAIIFREPLSGSRFLWEKNTPMVKNAVVLFRQRIDLPENAKKGFLRIYFDDSGTFYLNGKKTVPKNGVFQLGALKKGKHTLAFFDKNTAGPAAILYYGEITLSSGKKFYIHSDASVKAAAGPRKDNWFAAGYDDSSWQNALDMGDVRTFPWARWKNYIKDFTSPAEKQVYQNATYRAHVLPKSVKPGKFEPAKIVYRNGLPKILHGKQEILPFWLISHFSSNPFADTQVLRWKECGVDLIETGTSDRVFMLSNGLLNFTALDVKIRRFLNLNPDAKFILGFSIDQMKEFCRRNPSEIINYAAGKPENTEDVLSKRPIRPSVASEKLHAEIMRSIDGFGKFISKRPYANRVIGVRVSYGIFSEWHSFGMYNGPDTSLPMQKLFRSYLKKKYKTVAALRKAWNKKDVTFENAAVPGKERWYPVQKFFLSPAANAAELDFYDCCAHAHADLLLKMAARMKKVLPGRLVGAYYGYSLCNHPAEGATVLTEKVFSSPDVDFLSSPADYNPNARFAGGNYASRLPGDIAPRYGKLMLIEDDSRYDHVRGQQVVNYTLRTHWESYMTMRRNVCNAIFDRSGIHYNDLNPGQGKSPGFFDNPLVFKAWNESMDVMKKTGPAAAETGNKIAIVTSPLERLRVNTNPRMTKNYMGEAAFAYPLRSIYSSGYAVDVLTLPDFLTSKQNYKYVVLLNTFTLDKKERAAIKDKLNRPGTTSLFVSGCGFVTPEGFSIDAMSDFTGIRLRVDSKGDKAVMKLNSGISHRVPNVNCSERFTVDDGKAKTLGIYTADKKVACAEKILPGNVRSIYMGIYPSSPLQWRNALSLMGAKPVSGCKNYVRRRGSLLMVHTGTKGKHKITLPAPFKGAVELYSGQKYDSSVITVTSNEGPATWLFKCY